MTLIVSNLWILISLLTQGKILLFQYMAFLIFHSPNLHVTRYLNHQELNFTVFKVVLETK